MPLLGLAHGQEGGAGDVVRSLQVHRQPRRPTARASCWQSSVAQDAALLIRMSTRPTVQRRLDDALAAFERGHRVIVGNRSPLAWTISSTTRRPGWLSRSWRHTRAPP